MPLTIGVSSLDNRSMLPRFLCNFSERNFSNVAFLDLRLITDVVMSLAPTFVWTNCNRTVNPKKSRLRGYFLVASSSQF